MRLFPFALVPLALFGLAAVPLSVATSQERPPPKADAEPKQPETIDSLFSALRRESDARRAKRLSDRIAARWRDSGSATGNVLMQWADKAVAEKKQGLALDFLDQVTILFPDYPEGWNRRATLHFMMEDFAKSMTDINRVLELEPRHFGALSGMAAIMEATGRDALALRAWEQVLAVYPANREAQTRVGELSDKLTGNRT